MSAIQDNNETIGNGGVVYRRPDTDAGFITDATEIMQMKAVRKSDIINSELLGEFDENGVYTIDKNIIVQLVRLPKRITHSNAYGTFAEATVGEKTYHFRVTPTKVKDGKLMSQLELLEEIYHANGYTIDTRTTLLASYTLDPVTNFDSLALKKFHLSPNPDNDDFGGDLGDGNGVMCPDEADYIKHRQAYLKAMALVSLGLYERLEEAYYKKRLKILNSIPEAAVVLAEYKKQLAKLSHFFIDNSKRKYRAMNDLLTAIIEGEKGEALRRNPLFRAQMRDANRIYLNTVEQIDTSVQQSMEVINAVAQSMPIEEHQEIKTTPDFVVAVSKKEQNSNETNPSNKRANQSKPKGLGKSKSGGSKSGPKKDKGSKGEKTPEKKKIIVPSSITPKQQPPTNPKANEEAKTPSKTTGALEMLYNDQENGGMERATPLSSETNSSVDDELIHEKGMIR